jgi:hypothetical protein
VLPDEVQIFRPSGDTATGATGATGATKLAVAPATANEPRAEVLSFRALLV